MPEKWHMLSSDDVKKRLETTRKGLSLVEAKERLKKYGPNLLPDKGGVHPARILASQFQSFLVFILVAAAGISFLVGEMLDAWVIAAILVANALLGFYQEYKAERSLEALRQMAVPQAIVRRDGRRMVVPAEGLVPGDIILIEEGNKVPADCRMFQVSELRMNESMLTGESTTVHKEVKALNDVPVADRKCMLFMGTVAASGRGEAVVVSTGRETEIGKIAGMLEEMEETTPLQKKLGSFGKWLGLAILVVISVIFSLEAMTGGNIIEMLMVAIALAVSAVPEGLPAVVTITLAIGVTAMAAKNVIIRKLSAVETLGSTTVVCADKTGTMTTNEMTVQEVWVNGKTAKVTGLGFKPEGRFLGMDEKDRHIRLLSEISALCNNSALEKEEDKWVMIGDPTEGALKVMAAKAGVWVDKMKGHKRVSEDPFTSERKMMSVVYDTPKGAMEYVKGAPEIVLERCTSWYVNGRVHKLKKNDRQAILDAFKGMAEEGLRVLGMAYKPVKGKDSREKGLTFVGLAGMIDPPREEVKDAIRVLSGAGIRTVMITGDHRITALAIARKLGLVRDSKGAVLEGEDLGRMGERKLCSVVRNVNVYARVSPEHKVRILSALKKRGHIVAMTGDGVNDAPALKKADIGVAMGIRGTDVAKEASDMILLDDNFATIAKAAEQGRAIYDNIRKFIRFLLSANFDEIFVITAAYFAGLPLPLLPLQILWINLLTDGLPAVALSVDPPEKDIMERPPRKPNEGVMHGMLDFIIMAGILASISTLGIFLVMLWSGAPVEKARTMAFTTAIMFELLFVFNCRSETRSVFRTNPFSNRKLVLAVLVSVLLQFVVVYLPFCQAIFGTVALGTIDWLYVLGFSCLGLFVFPEVFMKVDLLVPRRGKNKN